MRIPSSVSGSMFVLSSNRKTNSRGDTFSTVPSNSNEPSFGWMPIKSGPANSCRGLEILQQRVAILAPLSPESVTRSRTGAWFSRRSGIWLRFTERHPRASVQCHGGQMLTLVGFGLSVCGARAPPARVQHDRSHTAEGRRLRTTTGLLGERNKIILISWVICAVCIDTWFGV